MKKLISVLSLALVLGFANFGNASLVDNGGGLIYDTDLNITWYDAPAAARSWSAQMYWASNLSKGEVTGWRLPHVENMDHLYYDELRNIANTNIGGNTNFKKGPFENLIPFQYFSADRVGFNESDVYIYEFNFGETSYGFEGTNMYALAVHSGNVGAPVPIPGAVWLLGPGLIGLLGMRRLTK